MKKRSTMIYLLALMFLTCTGYVQADDAESSEPVLVGAFYNLSGFQAGIDIPSAQGARLAVREINQKGGIQGRPLELVLEDGKSQPEVIREKTTSLFEQHPAVTALMGFSDTDMVLAAAPIAAEQGRLFLTSGATSPHLPTQVPTYLFLACFGDNVQAAAAAEWAHDELTAHSVAIVYDATKSYTQLLQDYFRTRFEDLNGQVVSLQAFTNPDELHEAARSVGKADLVFFSAAAPEDIVNGIQVLRKGGYTGPILGGDGFDAEPLWHQHPEFDQVYFTTHAYLGADNIDPKVSAFRKAYTEAYPETPIDGFAALGYDSVYLLATAISQARSSEPGKVLEALAGIDRFAGVTGVIGYPDGSRIPRKSVSIIRVEGGRRSLAKQLVPASVPVP